MDYFKHYTLLIKKAKQRTIKGYYEKHHIIPKCLNGTNHSSNLVRLTPEEHYLAHQLLIKIYPNNSSLIYAVNMMTVNAPNQRRNNKVYGWIKRKYHKSCKERIGIKNGSYGTMWITNGIENKKIKKDVDTIPEGWYKGRIIFQNEKKPKKERFCKYCKSVITQKYYLICETCRHTILEDYNNGMSEANLMKKYNWKSRQNITSFLDKSFPERSKTNKKRRKCSSGRMDYATDCNPVNIGSIPV